MVQVSERGQYETIVPTAHYPPNPPLKILRVLHMFWPISIIIWIAAWVLLGFFQGEVSEKW